jgi:hypothetical protein
MVSKLLLVDLLAGLQLCFMHVLAVAKLFQLL